MERLATVEASALVLPVIPRLSLMTGSAAVASAALLSGFAATFTANLMIGIITGAAQSSSSPLTGGIGVPRRGD